MERVYSTSGMGDGGWRSRIELDACEKGVSMCGRVRKSIWILPGGHDGVYETVQDQTPGRS